MKKASLILAAVLLSSTAIAVAQQAGPAAPTAEVKRLANGKPDFSGGWTHRPVTAPRASDPRGICVGFNCGAAAAGPNAGGEDGAPAARPAAGARPAAARPAPNFPNYKPEFKEKIAKFNKEQVKYDPALKCGNPGLPRIGPPDKLVQNVNEIVFLYEDLNGSFWRIVPTDGRPHRDDAEDAALGDSVGHWDGDKLVIETTNLGEDTWLTDNGAFHTNEVKVVEEFSMNGGKIDYKLTVNDPKVLVEPWVKTAKLSTNKNPLQPVPCVELSIDKMTGIDSYHANARW